MLSEQASMDHGAMNNEEKVNDHIEEDNHTDDIVEYDSTNTLIHDTFNVRMDDDDDNDHENIDEVDDVNDIPLLEKAYKPLYEGSNTNILYVDVFVNSECIHLYILYCISLYPD